MLPLNSAKSLRVLRVLKAANASLAADGRPVAPAEASEPSPFHAHETALIDPAAIIGSGSKIWQFSNVMAGAELGENCNVGQNVVISPGVKLGRNVKVQNNVSVYTGTTVEDDVFLGPSCVLTNISNPRSQINRRNLYETTLIKRGATIGANATVVCGVTIGRYAFIAAGAVVTKDVADYALVLGNPARQKGWMSRHGHPLGAPDPNGVCVCPESGLRYQEMEDGRLSCIDIEEETPLNPHELGGQLPYATIKQNRNAARTPAQGPA
jgi:UDP-2-acetamido-3-amino-2,3-dideoxy-glucuronate N-acetyltransferase